MNALLGTLGGEWPSGPDVALVSSYSDLQIARSQGFQRFVRMHHGVGQSYTRPYPNYPGGRDHADVEAFLVPNEYSAQRWRDAYPRARVEVVGSPRLDDLPARSPGPLTVAISFHFRAFPAPEMDTALRYYLPVLSELAERHNIIGHCHPKGTWPKKLSRIYAARGIEYVPTFDEVCRRADLYVCDSSSTIYEFASTGRPVLLLNSPRYRRSVRHGGRFWDWADVGLQVDHPGDLADAITDALTTKPDPSVLREVFPLRT